MQQLSPSHYPNVHPLYARLQCNLAIDSIIAGNTRGEIYVDQDSQPQSAVMWNIQDMLLVAGSASSKSVRKEMGDLLRTQSFPTARRRTIPDLALLYTPMVWETHIFELLAGMNFKKVYRRFYTAHKLKPNWRARLLPGIRWLALIRSCWRMMSSTHRLSPRLDISLLGNAALFQRDRLWLLRN